MTACPLSGLLDEEVFDVHPYAQKVAFAFLHKELTDSLPRKFKIAFSGCQEDCMLGVDPRCRPARRDPRWTAGIPHDGRRRTGTVADRGATSG